MCWQCAYKVSFESSEVMKGSLLVPALNLTIAITCRGCIVKSQCSNRRKRQEQVQEWDCLLGGCITFRLSEHSGLEPTSSDQLDC